jgi:hypothetical protein
MNRKSFWLVFLGLASTISLVFGQENFQPGYVIADTGDTLRGFIDYRDWTTNPQQIAFKNTPMSEVVTHGVDDTRGFHVSNVTYVRATIEHDINPTKIDELSYSPVPKYEKLTTFLLVMYEGTKSLYFHRDYDRKIGLYIRNERGAIDLLKNYQYRREGGQVIKNTMYKDQLTAYFGDCPEVAKKIKLLTYSEISLDKLFKTYYTSCSKDYTIALERKKLGWEFGVLGGVTAATLRFKGDSKLDPLRFDPSIRPTVGVSLNVFAPSQRRRFSVYNELLLSSYMFQKSQMMTSLVGGSEFNSEKQIGATYIKLTNMFRYNLFTGKTSIFLNAGMSNGIAVREKNKERNEYKSSAYTLVHDGKLVGSTRKYEQGLVLGIGAGFGKFTVELRREVSNGMSGYVELSSKVRRNSLLLTYRFH